MPSGHMEIFRRQEADAGSRRRDQRRGSRAPRAGSGKSRRDRQGAHHQFAVCRHPAHLAGRDRRRAPPLRLRYPLRAGRRGRLHRGRGREVDDEPRRLHHHRQLGAARPRQSRQRAGDVARRARSADHHPFRDVVCRASRGADAEDQSRKRRFVRALRLRRAAGRRAGQSQLLAGDQLSLRQDAADPAAPEEHRRRRQTSRRARALCQSDQRRAGAPNDGRASCAAAEGLQRRALSIDRRHHFRGGRRARHHRDRRQAV